MLDRRKQTLLRAVVTHYVHRAEPVASQFLASDETLGVRSATIRNELAEMTDLGYLRQPHTSAGRVPSDLGYRYYVDHLMTWERLPATEARALRSAQRTSDGDLEQLLEQTCRALSGLTRYTSVASPPTSDLPRVKQVHLVQSSPHQLLTVTILDNGQVVHRFCEISRPVAPAEVTRLGNILDAALRERPIDSVADVPLPQDAGPSPELLHSLLQVIARGVTGEESDLFVEGASHMLEQPEFREADRVEPLIRFLEARRSAYETLRRLLAQEELTVSIGRENPHDSMQEVSLVAARYGGGGRRYGWVGVLGPTRMHYELAIPAVQYAARILSETLSRMSGE